jgi:hypothetical protein
MVNAHMVIWTPGGTVPDRPPGWNEWTRDVPTDSSFMDSPPPEYMDEEDEEEMRLLRERQAQLKDEGVELLTPED